ncbi:hypothetical protein QEH59_18470 [Coraliomargarita sp. SDUM461004]|uniref:Uncharacterized protein n=1 Tax=Thalassobacterium sedimentorum TaxID=3041258 RepID=A0ABU1ARB1_9BACT|nr:hypothetical protein [Coraliomargarita sp. SDUM461004]MDQ8196420.1 hypothetical protein [Coraliomargarita sp. SDUM461004]
MNEETQYCTSYARRSLGVAIALLPFLVVVASLISPWHSPLKLIPIGLGIVAVTFTALNLWITLILPSIQKKKNESNGTNHSTSVFPILGTLFAFGACLVGFGHTTPSILALIAFLLDLGGLPWFIVFTWRDQSFWDTPLNQGAIQSELDNA